MNKTKQSVGRVSDSVTRQLSDAHGNEKVGNEHHTENFVGRVSPPGRNPTNNVQAREDVGLRDEAANPTYRARCTSWSGTWLPLLYQL